MARNPVFNEASFKRVPEVRTSSSAMTIQGTINKTFFLLFLCVLGGMITWTNYQAWAGYGWIMALGGFAVAMVTFFKPNFAPVTAPIYALVEGLFLGVISAMYNAEFEGIVFNAVAITIFVFFFMLFVYRTGIIKVTRGLVVGVFSATSAVVVLYLGSWILSLFGVSTAYLTSSSPLSIGISLLVCGIAAFNFLLDFHFINQMTEKYSVPKYMEWYAGLGLLVTLIWLYIEILNLLGKLQRR